MPHIIVKQIKCPVAIKLRRYTTVAQVQMGGNLTHLMHCSACGSTYPVGKPHPKQAQGAFVVRRYR